MNTRIKILLKEGYFIINRILNFLFYPNINSYYFNGFKKFNKTIHIKERVRIDKFSIIGSYTFIAPNTSITKSNIGNYCSIASDVKIGHGEHDISKFSTSVIFEEFPFQALTKKKCIIENDVWIGANAIILRGIKVSNGSVIGAGAVVTKDVPPYAIVVGAPARIVRYRFENNKIDQLIKSAWWNYPPEKVKEIINTL